MGLCSGVICFNSVWDEMQHLSAEAADDVGPPCWAQVTVASKPKLGGSAEGASCCWVGGPSDNPKVLILSCWMLCRWHARLFLSGLTLTFLCCSSFICPTEAVSFLRQVSQFNVCLLCCTEMILLQHQAPLALSSAWPSLPALQCLATLCPVSFQKFLHFFCSTAVTFCGWLFWGLGVTTCAGFFSFYQINVFPMFCPQPCPSLFSHRFSLVLWVSFTPKEPSVAFVSSLMFYFLNSWTAVPTACSSCYPLGISLSP